MARNERMNDNKKLLEEKVISISRITKVTKGGRIMRFAATVVVGDGKGLIGLGTGKGSGIVAGGAARAVLEAAGIKDIVSKSLGSNTQINVAKATLSALKSERTAEQIAELRGKKVEEL